MCIFKKKTVKRAIKGIDSKYFLPIRVKHICKKAHDYIPTPGQVRGRQGIKEQREDEVMDV